MTCRKLAHIIRQRLKPEHTGWEFQVVATFFPSSHRSLGKADYPIAFKSCTYEGESRFCGARSNLSQIILPLFLYVNNHGSNNYYQQYDSCD
jgi:hypothetical protein